MATRRSMLHTILHSSDLWILFSCTWNANVDSNIAKHVSNMHLKRLWWLQFFTQLQSVQYGMKSMKSLVCMHNENATHVGTNEEIRYRIWYISHCRSINANSWSILKKFYKSMETNKIEEDENELKKSQNVSIIAVICLHISTNRVDFFSAIPVFVGFYLCWRLSLSLSPSLFFSNIPPFWAI